METTTDYLVNLYNRDQLKQLDEEEIIYDPKLNDVKITELKRPPYSSRRVIENLVTVLINSLRLGFIGGIIVEETTMHVLDGWHRLLLWQRMGYKTIPCYLIKCTPQQERKLHLSFNTVTSTFNLNDFVGEFEGIDLEEFGFEIGEIKPELDATREKYLTQKKLPENGKHRLSTLIPLKTYDQLTAIKQEINAKTISDTIIHLVNTFHETI